MTVSARMVCTHVTDFGSHREVFFSAVYSSDKSDPNYSYSRATPQGSLRLVITNPDAFEQFEPFHQYDLTFTEFVKPTT